MFRYVSQEAAVAGSPDEDGGLFVKAFVIVKPGFPPSDTIEREIRNPVRNVTAPYKYSRAIDVVHSLPETISGKIRREEIRGQEMKKLTHTFALRPA